MKGRRWGVGGASVSVECWHRMAGRLGQRARERVDAASRAGGLEFGHKREPSIINVLAHAPREEKGGGGEFDYLSTICLPHPPQRCSCPSCSPQHMPGAPPRSQASVTQLHPRVIAQADPGQGIRGERHGTRRSTQKSASLLSPTRSRRSLPEKPIGWTAGGRPLSDAPPQSASRCEERLLFPLAACRLPSAVCRLPSAV